MPLDPLWRDVARILPDARPQIARNEKKHQRLGWMEPIFCVNCGHPGGMISKEWAAHVFYLCDDCDQTHGRVDAQLPDALVRGD